MMNDLSFFPFPDIHTRHLVLLQLRPTDDKEIMVLRSDEKILEFLVIPRCNNLLEATQFIDKINNGIKNNESIYWGITGKDVDTLIGTIVYGIFRNKILERKLVMCSTRIFIAKAL